MPSYIKLALLDVDGVLTNGTKIYGASGEVIAKAFADLDFSAIKRFKQSGIAVCWLSADRHINEAIAKTRGIDFLYARDENNQIDKVRFLPQICEVYGVSPAEIIYCCDDLFDKPLSEKLLELGGMVACPSNAVTDMKEIADLRLCEGGHGAIADLYNQLRLMGKIENPITDIHE